MGRSEDREENGTRKRRLQQSRQCYPDDGLRTIRKRQAQPLQSCSLTEGLQKQ